MLAQLIFKNLERYGQRMIRTTPPRIRILQCENMRTWALLEFKRRLDCLPVLVAVLASEQVYEKSGVNDPRR